MSSIGAVVGAMSADEASGLRSRMENAWFLVPGVGAQGGDPSNAMAGARPDGLGCLVNSSRAVLYPTGPDTAYEADPFPWIRAQAEAHAARFRLP
jgi:orotidine-5'-phosphate decarboxylase